MYIDVFRCIQAYIQIARPLINDSSIHGSSINSKQASLVTLNLSKKLEDSGIGM
jgi:hypothetical protein